MLQLDNQGARSTGKDKLSASVSLDNPLGIGDQVQLYANASQGSDYLKLGYSLPLGRDGLRAGIGASARTRCKTRSAARTATAASTLTECGSPPWRISEHGPDAEKRAGENARGAPRTVGGRLQRDGTARLDDVKRTRRRAFRHAGAPPHEAAGPAP